MRQKIHNVDFPVWQAHSVRHWGMAIRDAASAPFASVAIVDTAEHFLAARIPSIVEAPHVAAADLEREARAHLRQPG